MVWNQVTKWSALFSFGIRFITFYIKFKCKVPLSLEEFQLAQDLNIRILPENVSWKLGNRRHRLCLGVGQEGVSWFWEQKQVVVLGGGSFGWLGTQSASQPFPVPTRSFKFSFIGKVGWVLCCNSAFFQGMILCYSFFKNGTKWKHI